MWGGMRGLCEDFAEILRGLCEGFAKVLGGKMAGDVCYTTKIQYLCSSNLTKIIS